METEGAFLGALLDNPTDELTWLVLADWLEEQGTLGSARAELHRLRRALLHRPAENERPALERRLQELIGQGVRPSVPVLTNSAGMELALIPAGTFWMGSPEGPGFSDLERPRHEVTMGRPFFLGAHAVTQEQYQKVTGTNPSDFTRDKQRSLKKVDTRSFPVENVSHEDAVRFCERLSNLPPEKAARRAYRLPSEAQWEYACRAGISLSPFHFGDSLSSAQANVNGRAPDDPFGRYLNHPAPVGSYPPNAFGLFDMHGNVWEWVGDWMGPKYYESSPVVDPPGPETGFLRVLRGGSFNGIAALARSALRATNSPNVRHNYNGFRVALPLPRP